MVAILAEINILALKLVYCAYLVYGIVKRFKNGVIQGCGGSCAGCSGCGGGCCSSDPDEVKKMIECYLTMLSIDFKSSLFLRDNYNNLSLRR